MMQVIPKMSLEVIEQILSVLPQPRYVELDIFGGEIATTWSPELLSRLGTIQLKARSVSAILADPTKEKLLKLINTDRENENKIPRAAFRKASFSFDKNTEIELTDYDVTISISENISEDLNEVMLLTLYKIPGAEVKVIKRRKNPYIIDIETVTTTN